MCQERSFLREKIIQHWTLGLPIRAVCNKSFDCCLQGIQVGNLGADQFEIIFPDRTRFGAVGCIVKCKAKKSLDVIE